MKENSIEEDIILLKDFTEGNFKRDKLENYKGSYKMGYFYYKDIQQSIEHILSDYKRVLQENEKLKAKLLDTLEGQKIIKEETPQYIKENYILKEKVKDKIEYLEDYIEENSDQQGYWGNINPDVIYGQIEILEEILKESEE